MEIKKWLNIQIPLVVFIIIVWWLFFPQYNLFKFVCVIWLIKNFYPIFVGHTTLTNIIFNLTKPSVRVKKQNQHTRIIPVNGEDWAFDFLVTPLKNLGFLGDLSTKRYKPKNKVKPEKKAIFFIRDLIIKGVNKNEPFDVDILERDIYYFVYIGYKRQKNNKTKRSAYARKYWFKKLDVFVYYGCIHLLEINGCLINRTQGWTGENPFNPLETIKKLKGEKSD